MLISYHSHTKKNLVGDQVRALRLEQGLSQRALAAKLQLAGYEFSDLTILRIEWGKRLVTDIELEGLCRFFHTTPNQLMGFSDEPKK